MRSDRLLSIMLLLQTHGQLPASELAERLEVSARTIMRDVEALSASGVPVFTVRGPQGGIALLPGFRTDVTGLTADESRPAPRQNRTANRAGPGSDCASGRCSEPSPCSPSVLTSKSSPPKNSAGPWPARPPRPPPATPSHDVPFTCASPVSTRPGEEIVMGYRLQMSAEFHDWLAELGDRDPSTAVLAAQAVAALATEGDQLGPPLVTAVPDRWGPDELLLALERRYQDWLDSMAVSRHQGATAAAQRRKAERHLAELEPAGELESADELADARDRLAAAIEAQERLGPAHQRQQAQADAFRAGRTRRRAGPLPRSRPAGLRGTPGGPVRPGRGGGRVHVQRRAVLPRRVLPRAGHCRGGMRRARRRSCLHPAYRSSWVPIRLSTPP